VRSISLVVFKGATHSGHDVLGARHVGRARLQMVQVDDHIRVLCSINFCVSFFWRQLPTIVRFMSLSHTEARAVDVPKVASAWLV
jgi:hypothetical protein